MKKFLFLLLGLSALSFPLSAQVVIPWSDVSKTGAVPGDVGAAAASHTHSASQISDASANGRSLFTAADYAAMRSLLSLSNVNDTSDANKPVSTAMQAALGQCVPKTTTVNGHALSGSVTVTPGDVGAAPASHTHTVSQLSDASANGRSLLQASDFAAMRSLLSLGTAALLDAPASDNASSTQLVKGSDTRLTDTRTPTDDTVSTAKLQANAVTNAKAAQMAAHTIKGNNTGSTANAADLTIAQLKTELGVSPTSAPNAIPQLGNDGKLDVAMIPTNNLAIALRTGTEAERQTTTPAASEPIWISDTNELWVGDGTTVGGVRAAGLMPNKGLSVTYTGALQTPWPVTLSAPAVLIPNGAGSGTPVSPAVPYGVGATFWDYYEHPSMGEGALLSISFNNVVALYNATSPTITAHSLTTLSFPEVRVCQGTFALFTGDDLPALTTLSLPKLEYCLTSFSPTSYGALTTLDISKLKTTGAFQPQQMSILTTLSGPELERVSGTFNPNNMAAVTTFSFPKLKYVGTAATIQTFTNLTTISLPLLEFAGSITISSCPALTTVSLPGLVTSNGAIAMNSLNGNITTLTLGTVGTTKKIAGNVTLTGQKLNSASVNAVLALLVSLDGTAATTLWGSGKTVNLSGGTSAAPSGQGATDKSTLQGRGATVTTN